MVANINKKNSKKTKKVFKKKDYLSGDGMLTTIWGPSMWHFLHTMSFNYPVNPTKEDKINYRNFILNLKNVLPCRYCRENLKNNFKIYPLSLAEMKSRETFSKYIYNLHEIVNKMLGKKSGLSYSDVRDRYENFRSRCTNEKPGLFKMNKTFKKQVKNIKSNTKNSKTLKKEKGCTEPLYGKKAKCIIKIVPQEEKCKTMQIDKQCIKTRMD